MKYSPSKNAAYCLPCYLFVKPSPYFGANAFTTDGFQTWKKVNDGKNYSVKHCHDLMNSLQHIEKVIDKQSAELVAKNPLRLKVSIDIARLCVFQGITFRAHNEYLDSHNRGNFLEIIKHTASYNDEVRSIILKNAPQHASYISPQIQKEILSLHVSRIQRFIRKEIHDAKYYFIVDESGDESKKEQMAIVLRFVNNEGFIRERFFDVVHVGDTKASTLKREILLFFLTIILSYKIFENNEWNSLQALFLNKCLYAYYVHCFAHRLQLILVATTQSVISIEHFFYTWLLLHDQVQIANVIQIAELTSTNELETRKRKNQIGIIQRPRDTPWGSHLRYFLSLFDMFDHILHVFLSEIINEKSSLSTKASVEVAYNIMTSFEYVFVLHFMVELLKMIDNLCKILQYKSQDILNTMDAVAKTKKLVQKFRDNRWDQLFDQVNNFCEKNEIDVPNMNASRQSGRGRLHKGNPITLEHHYRIDIFFGIIDSILQEMSYRFDKNAIELLKLSSALDPRDGYKLFNINDICKLVEKFYSSDFTILSKIGNTMNYYLMDRLIKLILTLSVSTATTEHAFSFMKFVKTRLRNNMEDDFLTSSLLMYIEKEIAQTFSIDSIINEFDVMKKRRAQFWMLRLVDMLYLASIYTFLNTICIFGRFGRFYT
ncbi:hypothetical protein Pfo_005435 [Paulownia fortunei]|nr:hypothetical protein Pfo_005435 [Paulownia fortunei]